MEFPIASYSMHSCRPGHRIDGFGALLIWSPLHTYSRIAWTLAKYWLPGSLWSALIPPSTASSNSASLFWFWKATILHTIFTLVCDRSISMTQQWNEASKVISIGHAAFTNSALVPSHIHLYAIFVWYDSSCFCTAAASLVQQVQIGATADQFVSSRSSAHVSFTSTRESWSWSKYRVLITPTSKISTPTQLSHRCHVAPSTLRLFESTRLVRLQFPLKTSGSTCFIHLDALSIGVPLEQVTSNCIGRAWYITLHASICLLRRQSLLTLRSLFTHVNSPSTL